MKMFVFYFTAFFVDPNGSLPIPITNSFVYHTLEDCREVELLVIGVNEKENCIEKTNNHHLTNDPLVIEKTILRGLAKEFQTRSIKKK